MSVSGSEPRILRNVFDSTTHRSNLDEITSEGFDKSFESFFSGSKSLIKEDFNWSNQFPIINFPASNVKIGSKIPRNLLRTRKSIKKIKICFKKYSQAKNMMLKEVQKFRINSLKKHKKIVFQLVFNKEEKLKKSTKKSNKVKGSHKNLPKIIGSAIISFALNPDNSELVQKMMHKRSPYFEEKFKIEPQESHSLKDFYKWIKTENLKNEFVRLKTFREIWGYKLPTLNSLGYMHQFYCCVLKRISKHFLQNEFNRLILKKVKSKCIQEQNAICYLQKISVFMRGLKHQENFISIKELA